MNVVRRCLLWFAIVGLIALMIPIALRLAHIEPKEAPTPLEEAIARMPTGITSVEADKLIGAPPDEIGEGQGIIANPSTMFAATSVQGQKYGQPENFTFRSWHQDGVHASVAINQEGKVAARWTFREQPDSR